MAKTTYDDLLKDDNFLRDAYKALTGMGYNVSKKRGDILDSFLQKRRYFDVNIASTITQGDNIKDLSEENKLNLRNALDKTDELPPIFKKGSAPKWRAIRDYALAGVSDPTNLISIITGAFTLGTSTSVIFGAKEAAKQGIKNRLKAKANALVSKPVLKAMAVEGGISGAGGSTQNKLSQDVDMELGRREKGDYDISSIILQGTVEGVASPLAGGLLNLSGTAAAQGIKGLGKVTGVNDSQFVKNTQNFLEKWFMPAAGIDEISLRNIEIGDSAFRKVRQDAEDISEDIERIYKRDFPNQTQGDIDLINRAMQKDESLLDETKTAIDDLRNVSPDMADAITRFDELRKNVYKIVRDKDLKTSPKVQRIFRRSNKYTRDIYETYTQAAREPLQKFLARPENEELFENFVGFTLKDDNTKFGKIFGVRDTKTGKLKSFADPNSPDFDESKLNNVLMNEFKNLYTPSLRKKTKYGALKSKDVELPDVLKQIYGLNLNPAVRALQTISGIVEPVADLRIASGLGESLLRRNLAVYKPGRFDASEAAAELGVDEAVPLIASKSFKDQKREAISKAPFTIRGDIFDPELGNVYIPKELADKISAMTDRTGYLSKNEFLGPFAQAFAASQGYMKKGKTVYSPFAHVRNFLGAMQNVANSGNWTGIGKYTQGIRKLPKAEKEEFFNRMKMLGIEGTNVELNQILNRLSDLAEISEDNLKGFSGWSARNIVRVTSLGVSSAEKTKPGRAISRKLERLYTKTDDLGKMMAFLGERSKAQKMFDEMTDVQKNNFRQMYRDSFPDDIPVERVAKRQVTKKGQPTKTQTRFKKQFETNLDKFDSRMLDEFATEKALNVMPVYSRIPRILEKMRGIPVIGSFTAFPAENLRNKYNVLRLGAEEIRDGFALGNNSLIRTGANRLLSQGAVASAPVVAAYVYNEANGTDKVMPFIRKSFPEWARYHALQIRKRINKQGEDEYAVTDLSYNNPDQFVLDIIGPLMVSAANGEDVSENLDRLFKDVIIGTTEPFVDKSLALQYAEEALGFIRATDELTAANKLARMYKIAEPGLLKNLREIAGDVGAYQALDKFSGVIGSKATPGSFLQSRLEPLYYGEKRRYINDAASVAGYLSEVGLVGDNFLIPFTPASRETVFNPKKQLGFAVKTLMKNANSDFNISSSEIKKRLQDTEANFTLKGMLDLYKDSVEEQFAAQQGVHELIQELSNFKSLDEIKKILKSKDIKQASGLSDKEINNLAKGIFTPPKFDNTFFKELRKNYPEMSSKIPYISTQFIKLYNKYTDRKLINDLPEINIRSK